MPVSIGLLLVLVLLLAVDAWSLAQRAPGTNLMLTWGTQRYGLALTLVARDALVLGLAITARLLAGPDGDWLVLAMGSVAATAVWLRLRKLARDNV